MTKILLALCLCLSGFMSGCVETDEPLTSDESAIGEGARYPVPHLPDASVPGPRPDPRPVPDPFPPSLGCVADCQRDYQACVLHMSPTFEGCGCAELRLVCFAGCGLDVPMPACDLP